MHYFFYVIWLFILPASANTMSIVLKNAPAAEIISFLAEEDGKNIVLHDELNEIKALRMENSHFEEIMNSIAKINRLTLQKEKNLYSFLPEKTQQSNPSPLNESHPSSAPKLRTQTFKLYYAKASELIDSLTKGHGNILSENGYLHFDERSNSLIIKDSAESLKHFSSLLKEMDKPTEQIAIEARIVTISSEHLQELGVRWGVFSQGEGHRKFAGNLEGNGLKTNNLNVNFPVNNAASMVLQVASINSRVLDLELSALERENSVEIIASPRLLTTNKKSASIKQGTEIPYAVYSKKDEITDIEFREAVLGLEVTPHISKDNQILLDLIISQNSPNNQTGNNTLITIDKQEINTQVFAKHGETIVLGGIFQHLISKGEDKVPILGSIPVIKYLFSQNRDKISKRELVIFVTPYIVQSAPISASNSKKAKQK
ncbi:type IV pilus secretin PilQ [Glaesserella sp.]|uniref:type IV pilus secretin PilQ n=1 Tax=Glaesserella sp. TaxID=2094731 RepID=UPI0035A00EB1